MAFDNWHGYDLTQRKAKILNAFGCGPITSAEEFPIIMSTGNYYAFGGTRKPLEYWTDPACMLEVQIQQYEEHLEKVDDDQVPYFMPWFGTGVLASAFGCPVRMPESRGHEPLITGAVVHTPKDAAKLKMPDPTKDGLMPEVLRFVDYAMEHGDLPVGPTDLNSPLSTVAQICGHENLFVWMYEEPELIHDLMAMVTEAFIAWVKVQKQHNGESLGSSNGLQGVWSPTIGVWVSDDDIIAVSGELAAEFVVPYYSKLFSEFQGGSMHFCGNGVQHLVNFPHIKGLKAINNSPMGNEKAFTRMVNERPKHVMLQIQDGSQATPELYYENLFQNITDFSGLMVAGWVLDDAAMTNEGGYKFVSWDSIAAANRAVKAIRSAVAQRMASIERG